MEEEFQSFFNELGPVSTAGYKFFNSFKINLIEGIITFHKDFHCSVEVDILKDFKIYIKEEKRRCTESKKNITVSSVRQRVIFFITKLNEYKVFSLNDRKYIFMYWQTLDDLCI